MSGTRLAQNARRTPVPSVTRAGRTLAALLGATFAPALALGLTLAPAVARLADAASATATVTLSASIAQPGDSLTVIAAGLGGPGDVPILLAGPGTSVTLDTVTADREGGFTTTVTIPADTADGDYDVVVFDTAEDLVQAPLHVGPPTTGDTSPLDTSGPALDTPNGPAASAAGAAPDPYPVPEGIRDVVFVLLVGGSLALAAWGAGPGPRP